MGKSSLLEAVRSQIEGKGNAVCGSGKYDDQADPLSAMIVCVRYLLSALLRDKRRRWRDIFRDELGAEFRLIAALEPEMLSLGIVSSSDDDSTSGDEMREPVLRAHNMFRRIGAIDQLFISTFAYFMTYYYSGLDLQPLEKDPTKVSKHWQTSVTRFTCRYSNPTFNLF